MTRLISVGHAALDSVYRVAAIPTQAVKIFATGYIECGGGMAANASVAAARLGAQAHYWGRVGDDSVGVRILEQLVAEGVGIESVRRLAGRASPTAAIMVADDGERLICVYTDPAFETDAAWLPIASVSEFDVVLADVRWPAGALAVMSEARLHGIPTVLDGDMGAADALQSLSAVAAYSIFSAPGLVVASGDASPGQGLLRMQASAGGMVGVTLGPEGLLWIDGGKERREPAPRIAAVDTLAAGDVFHAAFAIAIAAGEDIAAAARFANAAAALKCTRPGGRLGAPTRAEVDAFLGDSRAFQET